MALRELSIELSKRGAGEPIITPFLTELALLMAIGLLIGLILLLSQLPIPTSYSAPILFIIAATLALLSGFFVPHLVRHGLLSHRDKAALPAQKGHYVS